MKDWKEVIVSPETTLGDSIARINASGLQAALVLSAEGRLLGILTDGNIRRAILAGTGLAVPVANVMTSSPTARPVTTGADELLALMRRTQIHHVPLLDADDKVVGLATLDQLTGAIERPNWVVLMAGGLGTRLHPHTDGFPKSLLSVGGKPILETIVESFAEQGFKRIFVAVNYKAEMIRDHFGAGDRWGVQVEYLHESSRLGTAGALSLLPETPGDSIVVMNGDLLTRVNFENFLQFHGQQGTAATMAVREYDFQVPYGVVQLEGTRIEAIQEKPVQKFFVNAGIYALSPEAMDHIPANSFFDMPALFESLIRAGRGTAAYPLREYWLDIGRIEEFERAQREWVADSNG